MNSLGFDDNSKAEPTLQASDIARLRQTIGGDLVLPDDPDYDQARRVWNGMVDKRPAAIVYCAGSDDVVTAISFARSRKFIVSVRGGATISAAVRCAMPVW